MATGKVYKTVGEINALLNAIENAPNIYTTPAQVEAQVAAQVAAQVEEGVAHLAEKDGSYPQMSVGFAEHLVGDGTATSEEFSFRPTAGVDRNVETTTYDYDMRSNFGARIESVKGNSVVWNQLVDTDTTTVALVSGRKYYTLIGGASAIITASATSISVTGGTDEVTDLTQMFGVGNEPSTVEEFYALLPKGVDLNAYNEGEIVDANYGAIKTTGFNQWDEQWELNKFDEEGNKTGVQSYVTTTNYIPIIGGARYYANYAGVVWYFYDNDKNFLIRAVTPQYPYTTPENARYALARLSFDYGKTYKNDICINLVWDEYASLNRTYKPYKPFERDLSWVAQYFPDGMRRAGSVCDEIRFNSTTQKWEAVQNVDVRAYASGDESDTTFITDGTNTNYPLATPVVTEIEETPNLDYDVADYGTEELIVADGVKSAPFLGDIIYTPNALKTLEQVPDILRRLAALENA